VSVSIVSTMVNDNDRAAEGFADGVGGADIGAHVFVSIFRAEEAAIERVQNDGSGRSLTELALY
jgi:hypothetical protein